MTQYINFGQNPSFGSRDTCRGQTSSSGDTVQTRLIFTVFIVWWPWKLGQGHQNLINSFNDPNDTIHTGSKDRVQTSCFGSKFDIQSAGVTLKMRSRSPKSNHFFPMSHWCFCVSLVKIHQLVRGQPRAVRQGEVLRHFRISERNFSPNFEFPYMFYCIHLNFCLSSIFSIHKVWSEPIIWLKW